MQIKPSDYVAVSDITCEAIHAAVVKCFEAAGGHANDEQGIYGENGGADGLCISVSSGNILWGGQHSCKRQLTLQQLFTATNSIRWPDWAVDIRLDVDCVYFTDAVSKFQMFIAPGLNKPDWAGDGISENLAGTVLAVRLCNPVSDATIRPAPELTWYDWSADKPRELPPVGAVCEVLTVSGHWEQCKILDASIGVQAACVTLCGGGYVSVLWGEKFRPANYGQRKAELARERIIAAAEKVIKTTSSAVDNVALTALYEAGLLRERAV